MWCNARGEIVHKINRQVVASHRELLSPRWFGSFLRNECEKNKYCIIHLWCVSKLFSILTLECPLIIFAMCLEKIRQKAVSISQQGHNWYKDNGSPIKNKLITTSLAYPASHPKLLGGFWGANCHHQCTNDGQTSAWNPHGIQELQLWFPSIKTVIPSLYHLDTGESLYVALSWL